MIRVLLVEDEAPIRDMLRFAFSRAGLELWEAEDVAGARKLLARRLPDILLLDWMLPDSSGISLLRELRKNPEQSGLPIIMLTARAEEADRVRGLEEGADDYVTKPFSPKELVARIQAVLRRQQGRGEQGLLQGGGVVLDPLAHWVQCDGQAVQLGPTEFRLLEFLLSHQERVYTRGQLLDNVWSRGEEIEERTVDVSIRRLRKALALYRKDHMIQTVRGLGYVFSADAERVASLQD